MIVVDGGDGVELGHRSSEDEGDDDEDDVPVEVVLEHDDEMWNDSVEYLDEVGVKIGVTGSASSPSRELMVMMTAAAVVVGRNSFHQDVDFASRP